MFAVNFNIFHICEIKVHKTRNYMKSLISTKSLSLLKKKLPPNGMELIAKKLSVSQSTVSRVINGITLKRQEDVVFAAIEVIKEEKERLDLLNREIERL